ncbi:MAG: hypothetical protein ACYDG3_14525 [Bacillati bacterium]
MKGGLIRPDVIAKHVTPSPINVTWSWYDEAQGLVQWTFKNTGTEQASCILLRNQYYFGNAFWPVYVANPGFATAFAAALTPLVDNGVANNSPPLAVVDFGNGNRIIAFVFTLSPNQIWSMLEGGFSSVMPPVFQQAPIVTLENSGSWCIGYDSQQVIDWDTQTGTNLQGYSPNPSAFNTVEVSVTAPYIALYNDTITQGTCSGGSAPNACVQEIIQGFENLANGNSAGLIQIEEGIICLVSSLDISFSKLLMKSIKQRLEKMI